MTILSIKALQFYKTFIPLHNFTIINHAKIMSYLIKPANYKPLLDMKQTELGIKQIKDFFQQNLSSELRLRRVTAPLFVLKGMGINDDLNGVERPVTFPIKDHCRPTGRSGTLACQMEKSDPCRLSHRAGIWHLHRHECHPCRRRTGQPALALRRPMGLGTGHHARTTHRRISEKHRDTHLCRHAPH